MQIEPLGTRNSLRDFSKVTLVFNKTLLLSKVKKGYKLIKEA